jgi:hypothetical protein
MILSNDMSAVACSLKEVVVQCQYEHVQLLSYLPLYNLDCVSFYQDGLQLPTAHPKLLVRCRPAVRNPGGTPNMRSALVNLERCPAWQHSGLAVYIRVYSSEGFTFYDSDLHDVLDGLSAVASKHVQLRLNAGMAFLQESTVQ